MRAADFEVNQRVNWCVIETAIHICCRIWLRALQTQSHFAASGLAIQLLRPLKLHRSKAFGSPKPVPYLNLGD
jgi:hypothetical protein